MNSGVRTLQEQDVEAVVELQRHCFPPPFPEELLWKKDHILAHRSSFPEGQLVHEINGAVVASCTNMKLSESAWRNRTNWETLTGGHFLTNHDPNGVVLLGIDISVHPNFRKRGIARALYERRFELVRQLGLTKYATCSRLPDRKEQMPHAAADEYCKAVKQNKLSDRTLTPLLRMGLTLIGTVNNFMEDEESGHSAAVLEWTP